MKRAVALTVALAFTGCSFIAVNGPDIAPGTMPMPGDEIDCSESRAAPIVDVVLASLMLMGAISAFIDSRKADGAPLSGEAAVAIAAVAAVFGASAYFGFSRTSECRRVRELYGQ